DPFPPREISYKLRVVTNLPPEVDEDMAKTYGSWPMLEDRVDEGILLTDLFIDPEGRPLTFRVVPGHNGSRLNVMVTGADRLRLEPAENASGFVESVTVEAMDGRGKTVRFTIDVAVIAVNDAPMAGHPTASPPPEVLEMDEDTTGGPWDLLFWFWDCDNAMSEMTFSFEIDLYLNAGMDEMDRLVIDPIVPDWNGRTNITIRVKDPEGLGALIRMPVVVRPVNDPPRRMGPDLELVVPGGVVAIIDVTSSFMDVDGDILTLLATSDQPLTFVYDGYNITVDGLLPYQFWMVGFNVTVKDPQDAVSAPLVIILEVRDMEDPHTIEAWEAEYTLLWGRGRYFTGFTVSDPDGGHYVYVVVLSVGDWSVEYEYRRTTNGWEWVSSRPYWAPEWGSEEGDVVVTLAMYDSWYNAIVSWVVHVRAENHPPEILEMLADTPGPYWLGQKVEFTTEVVDEEGDDLSYGWYLEGELVSAEPTFTLTFDTMGEQELVLEVSDGFNTTQRDLPFAVVEEAESLDPPIWTLAIVLVAALVVILALVFFLARR
ncbi:MAG: PKD domain-containing protein, partial [Candidatus Thermoplasmatota archaeon]|nr:PKD domain-containing protein [Candidatus Thermoplasmatota archaeon]